ncbi:MAG: formyltransferase family protein [Armatimonadota bacterium]
MQYAKVLLIGDTSSWSEQASALTQEHFSDVLPILWHYGDEYPSQLNTWEGDLILSFKNDLVLSPDVLQKAKCAINFHPAPPKYRGVGGYYYAIANGDRQYGVTCHHMVERIDYGPIIQVAYFPLEHDGDVTSLKEKAGRQCLLLLQEILPLLVTGQLPLTDEVWGSKLFTRAELEGLRDRHKNSDTVTCAI